MVLPAGLLTVRRAVEFTIEFAVFEVSPVGRVVDPVFVGDESEVRADNLIVFPSDGPVALRAVLRVGDRGSHHWAERLILVLPAVVT